MTRIKRFEDITAWQRAREGVERYRYEGIANHRSTDTRDYADSHSPSLFLSTTPSVDAGIDSP